MTHPGGTGDAPAPRLILASSAHAGPAQGTGTAPDADTQED